MPRIYLLGRIYWWSAYDRAQSRLLRRKIYRRQSLQTSNKDLAHIKGAELTKQFYSQQSTANLTTVESTLTAWLSSTKHERSPGVQLQAERRIRRLPEAFRILPLDRLTSEPITDALNWLMDAYHLSAVTRDHYLKLIRAGCLYARAQGWMPRNPTDGIAAIGHSPSRAYLPFERWWEFLGYAKRSKTYPGTATALMAGLRRGELGKMIADDFSLTRRQIRVRVEVSKTKQEVTMPMMKELVPILKPVLARLHPQDRVFPYYAPRWQVTVKGWLKKMGYSGIGLGLHTLRHSFCTWAYERFGEYKGQTLARHASLEMARRYVHLKAMPVSPSEMSLEKHNGEASHRR